MNRIRTLLVAALVLGISSIVSAQEPEREKPAEPEAPKAAPAPKPQEPKEAKPEKAEKPEPEKQPKEKPSKDAMKPAHEDKAAKEQMIQGGGSRKGGHIPDPQFKSSFGRQHSFSVNRVITQRTVVVNQTQFVYGGYTFLFVDPWPAEWAYTDDCYIDYINEEYVLVDVLHPGVYVALVVVS